MGGNHKKNLRSEKAKVKLKGAKLPKGLNVTKTEFKVRKIIIREQLKGTVTQYAEGERQLNLQETLSRLKHHSSNFRSEALRKLREAITAGQMGVNMQSQLSEFIQAVAAIALDVDKDTRRESFKTLSSLLGALPAGTVAPFFHIMSSYLRCAMTHIQPQIQEDSLLLLDVLLQHTPHLIAMHSAKIFHNFLEMVSRVRAEGDRAGRMLTVHMGQHQTTIKWRSKVLQRLQQMLHTLVEHNRVASKTSGIAALSNIHTFNVKEPQHYALKRNYYSQKYDISSVFYRISDMSASSASIDVGAVDEATLLRSYVDHLFPLLLDAWLEVRAPEISGGTHVLLSHEAALTLKVVLEIIENLWSLVEIHEQQVSNDDLSAWLRGAYGELFSNGFLQSGFPYQQRELVATAKTNKKCKKGGSSEDAGGQYCLPQNVSIAYLMCRFNAQQTIDEQLANKFDMLLQYLNTIVDTPRSYALDKYPRAESALRAYLLQHAHELLQLKTTQQRQLLRATVQTFLSNQFSSKDAGVGNSASLAAKVLVLLCDIAKRPQLTATYGAQEFTTFLQYLPQLLLRPTITEAALISMSHLGKQKNVVFLQALEQQVQPVIENVQSIQVLGACNAFEGKKNIMNLFYWTERSWRNEPPRLEQLANALEQYVTDKRIVSYYKFILSKF